MNKSIVTKEFEGLTVSFTTDGWFNATFAAAKWDKIPRDWLKQNEVKEYIDAVAELSNVSAVHLTKVVKGGRTPGTWLHPNLAVGFARWLNPRFAAWCDIQIKGLLVGKLDQNKARHQAAASYKVMQDVLKMARQEEGKETQSHHYSNEARLINWALTGQFTSIDRDELSKQQLDALSRLEERNALMIAMKVPYQGRKLALEAFFNDLKCSLIAA